MKNDKQSIGDSRQTQAGGAEKLSELIKGKHERDSTMLRIKELANDPRPEAQREALTLAKANGLFETVGSGAELADTNDETTIAGKEEEHLSPSQTQDDIEKLRELIERTFIHPSPFLRIMELANDPSQDARDEILRTTFRLFAPSDHLSELGPIIPDLAETNDETAIAGTEDGHLNP